MFGTYGLVNRPSDLLYIRIIPLPVCMDRRSCYNGNKIGVSFYFPSVEQGGGGVADVFFLHRCNGFLLMPILSESI